MLVKVLVWALPIAMFGNIVEEPKLNSQIQVNNVRIVFGEFQIQSNIP